MGERGAENGATASVRSGRCTGRAPRVRRRRSEPYVSASVEGRSGGLAARFPCTAARDAVPARGRSESHSGAAVFHASSRTVDPNLIYPELERTYLALVSQLCVISRSHNPSDPGSSPGGPIGVASAEREPTDLRHKRAFDRTSGESCDGWAGLHSSTRRVAAPRRSRTTATPCAATYRLATGRLR
jgi:hypothetical protein